MRDIDEHTITAAVLQSMQDCRDPRLLEILSSLVTHLHGFAREVRLTESEWMQAIGFLTAAGHITDDKRQEFILLSDTLGLSTLVTAQNNAKPAGCTEATVLGPFHVDGAPVFRNGDDIANGASGEPCFVQATIRSLDGEPIANAQVDVWQSDEDGFYDVQLTGTSQAHRARGRLFSDAAGRLHFRSILANHYPIPHDGPVGRMLDAVGRHPWRPAHLHFIISAAGYETLTTHVFRDDDPYLDSDAVFGVRSSLVAPWHAHQAGIAPDGSVMAVPFYTLEFAFVLNPTTPA
ncbi:intradiol ring-cleavage dioxygenase [soil metagenome]